MRLSLSSLLPSLLLVASTGASEANVYLSNGGNPHHVDSPSPSTSASNARLVFAQRLGVAQYHTLKDADASSIDILNDFGGTRRRLFGADAYHNRPKAMLIVEGVEDFQDIAPTIPTGSILSFRIQDPPALSANARLLQDIRLQAKAGKTLEYSEYFYDEAFKILEKVKIGEKSTEGLKMSTSSGRVLAHVTSLQQVSSQYGSSSAEYKSAAASVREAIATFFQRSETDNWEVIVAAMPPKRSGGVFKRSSTASWGPYSLPKRQESGRPDFLPNDFAGTETNVENPPANEIDFDEFLDPNEPLRDEDITIPTFSDVANLPGSESEVPQTETTSHSFAETIEELFEDLVDEIIDEFTPASSDLLSTLQNNTTPPLGILPTCYTTYDACVSTTNNCSGHGTCFKKFEDVRRDSKRACFVCGCQNTYRYDSQGRKVKTTIWAGPACQKKDVSMPFWLLGGLTVLLVSIVAWGIGLLYSMGSEDLPSVIGAGVAGPRAK